MKLLFLLDDLYSYESPNVRIGRAVAGQLAEKGHDVAFLTNCRPGEEVPVQGLETHFFCFDVERRLYEHVVNTRTAGHGFIYQAFSLLARPKQLFAALQLYIGKKSVVEKEYRRRVEQLCANEEFDAVVSVSSPFYTALALADANIAAKKVCYFLDPYATNESNLRFTASRRRERALYEKVDAVVLTDLMYNENMAGELAAYKDKMHVLALPGVARPVEGEPAAMFPSRDAVNVANATHGGAGRRVRCEFVGTLYPSARDPQHVLEVFARLPEDICLRFTGLGYDGFAPGFFEGYQKRMGERLSLAPPVEKAVADRLVRGADVLVNIGNDVKNQLPSKIFEYISTGKPVLNFYKFDACPTLPYFRRYPPALNVRDGDMSEETLAAVRGFCRAAGGAPMAYEEVEALFAENTLGGVGDAMEAILRRVTAGRESR